MSTEVTILLGLGAAAIVLTVALLAIIYGAVPVIGSIKWLVRHLWMYLKLTVTDSVRLLGHVLTAVAVSGFVLICLMGKRQSKVDYYTQMFTREGLALAGCMYRLVLGYPARLFYLHGALVGIEQRLPRMIGGAPPDDDAALPGGAPGGGEYGRISEIETGNPVGMTGQTLAMPDAATAPISRPRRGYRPQFDDYEIMGTLAGGGSGGKLYVARPSEKRCAEFAAKGVGAIGDLVIKSFSIREGSSLPQIIRESRSLEAAQRLGLIIDYNLSADRFYYVMRYVPGSALSVVTRNLHGESDAARSDAARACQGLCHEALLATVAHCSDLVATLHEYHQAGLWHKDIKPDNIIVHSENQRAYLVDFGLLTSLRSTMTLTTHGTEYFRDPEMVRLALRGVKVRDVDGCRFDIYGAGAVLYSVLENSFPAHGAMSAISRPCPAALKWVVRRAMTDYAKRYRTAEQMLLDLETVRDALLAGPEAAERLRPADLPSVKEEQWQEMLDAGEVKASEREGSAFEVGARCNTHTAPLPYAGTFVAKAKPTGVAGSGVMVPRREDGSVFAETIEIDGDVDLRLLADLDSEESAAGAADAIAQASGDEQESTSKTRRVSAGSTGSVSAPSDDVEVTMRQDEAPAKSHAAGRVTPAVDTTASWSRSRKSAEGKVKQSPATIVAIAVFCLVALYVFNLVQPAKSRLTAAEKLAAGTAAKGEVDPLLPGVNAPKLSGAGALEATTGARSGGGDAQLPPALDAQTVLELGGKLEEQFRRAFGADFIKGLEAGTRDTLKNLERKSAGGGAAAGKPTPDGRGGAVPGMGGRGTGGTGGATAATADEPEASGIDLIIDHIAIDLHGLPQKLTLAAIGASMAALSEEDVQRARNQVRAILGNPLLALNVRTRLLLLTDADLHEAEVAARTLEQVDLALRGNAVVSIRQRLDEIAVVPNLESTLAAVGTARFGNRDDAPAIRLAMKDLPGSPFCVGFLWLIATKDPKMPVRGWLVLQPDTDPVLATEIIRTTRLVFQGRLASSSAPSAPSAPASPSAPPR